MGTQYSPPSPPDWKDSEIKNIELSYDPNEQGTVAWIDEYVGPTERVRRKICWMPDAVGHRHEKDLKLLMSWATRVDVRPNVPPDHPAFKAAYLGWCYYPLPATPMVMEILHRLDYTGQETLWRKLRTILLEIHDAGFYINVCDPPAMTDDQMLLRPDFPFSLVK